MKRNIKIGKHMIPLWLLVVLLIAGIFIGFLADYILRITMPSEEIFILTPSNVAYEVWLGFNNDAVGNASFADGRFRMWINDTSGGWGLAKLARGVMPHNWGVGYAPLENEIEISRTSAPEIKLDIMLKLVEYRNYTNTNSSMNVAVCFFSEGYITDYQQIDYQQRSYQTEIQFFSYYGDRIQKDQEWYFVWRNDSVAQFKLTDNLNKGKIKRYEMNITPYVLKMISHYGLTNVKLKHIEIFTEAHKGYSEFEVYDSKIILVKRSP